MQDLPLSILTDSAWPDTELCTDFAPAIMLSLFSDGRSDEIPRHEASRRGYWADSIAPKEEPTGSKLWTLANKALNDETLELAIQYAFESLSWLLLEEIVSDLNVDGEIEKGRLILSIEVVTIKGTYPFQLDWMKGYHGIL